VAEQVRANTWRGFREYVQELGGDADAYLRGAGVDPAVLAEPDAHVPFADVIRSLETAAADLNRPDFGLQFGLRQTPGVTGPIMFAVMNCSTVRESMECAARFIRFHNGATRLWFSPAAPGCEALVQQVVMAERPVAMVQQSERMISFLHMVMTRLGGGAYAPLEIWFEHAPVSPPEVYRAVFGVTPRFGQPHNGIVMTSAFLDTPQPGRSEHLRELAVAYLEKLCPSEGATVTSRVRAALEVMMRSGEGAQGEVAQALAMHERTLQRRLKEEGAVFEDIKDAVRRAMASAYLRQRNLPLSQVAELLGYAEPSALSRSCRRWFGETPSAVRKRLAA
jgi:AraC-like DNA-binding protein